MYIDSVYTDKNTVRKIFCSIEKIITAFLNLHQQFEGQTEIQTAVKFLYPSDSEGATSKAKQNFRPITVPC